MWSDTTAPQNPQVAIDREKALQQAQKFIDKKRYDRALEEYQRVLREDPNDSRTLLKLGDLQIRMQSFADAMSTYDRVGQLYESQGFAVKAVAVYKQIREHIQKRSPDLGERFAHVTPRLARIYVQLQLTSDAIQAFDEVATRLMRIGKRAEAVETFREMVSLDPNNPLTHVRLAEALCHLAELEEGQASFARAAELLLKLGRHEDASRVVERGLFFRAEPRLARLAAEIYLKRGSRNDGLQALSKLQVCFQADPKDLSILGMLAQAFNLLEQSDKAIEVQKQMALLAREKGEHQLFAQLVHYLSQVAPTDDQVRAMLLITHPEPVALPPPSVVVSELSDEDVMDDEVEEIEEIDDVEFVDAPGSFAPASRSPGLVVSGSRSPTSRPPPSVPPSVRPSPDSAPSLDPEAVIARALTEAEYSQRLRLFPRAVATLRQGLTVCPTSLELRYRLREVLYEQGDHEGMLAECLTIARILIEYGYLEDASAFVQEVLNSQPTRDEAIQLYTLLHGKPPAQPVRERAPSEGSVSRGKLDSIPSYDLEGLNGPLTEGGQVPSFDYVDDPFGTEEATAVDTELPSFALDDAAERAAARSLHTHPPSTNLEDVLDQVDSLAQVGRLQEARQLLDEQLQRTPNHPLVVEKQQELGFQSRPSRTPPALEESRVVLSEFPSDTDELRSTLNALDHLEMKGGAVTAVAAPALDVDTMFAQFKEGVRSHVEESDTATHYDLGVAYKEMGLVGDATKEFELAARDPARECMCYAMIGLIHLEQNELSLAMAAYTRGLSARVKTPEQELSLYYDLAIVHEMLGEYERAIGYLLRIARVDPGYRDIQARLTALGQPSSNAAAAAPRAVNAEDEFERAFDDIFRS